MKRLIVSILTLVALSYSSHALAWDSECGGCSDETKYREPWLSGGNDEHRRWMEDVLNFVGVDANHRSFALLIPRRVESLELVGGEIPDFSTMDRFEILRKGVAEFAQLPDYGYSLGDWVTQFDSCPPSPGDAPVPCHKFEGHMGVLNSNHFLPQAELWYSEYHALARSRAAACATLKQTLEVAGRFSEFREFSDECVQEALTLEAIAQHFLQDAWSSGHMWERWGSPTLEPFPGNTADMKLLNGLIVALSAGLIHGTEPVTEIISDPMCAPDPRVAYISDRGMSFAVGDRHRTNVLLEAPYATQRDQLLSCAAASVADIYQAAGEEANGPVVLDPSGCFSQRVTNRAIQAGFEELAVINRGLLVNLAEFKRDHFVGIEAELDLRDTLRRELREMRRVIARAVVRDAQGTELAHGGLGALLGVRANGLHLQLPAYKDPANWAPMSDQVAEAAIPRAFHRAHVREWCDVGTADYLDTLRARAAGDPVAQQVCVEVVRRHVALTEAIELPPRLGCPGEPPPIPDEVPDPKVSLCQLLGSAGRAIEVPVNFFEPPVTDVSDLARRWCSGESFTDPPAEREDVTCPDPDPGDGDDGGDSGGDMDAGTGGAGPGSGGSFGDPHLLTLDGLVYDFQAQGELVLVRSTVDDLEIQARQQPTGPAGPCASTAWNSALAFRVGGQRVSFDARREGVLRVGGVLVNLAEGERSSAGDGSVERLQASGRVRSAWLVRWADGSRARVELSRAFLSTLRLDLTFKPAATRAGTLEGLLGNFNGDPADDLALADGTNAATATGDGPTVDDSLLYGAFADSWRVTLDTSLMDYAAGQTTADYQLPGLPTDQAVISIFPSTDVEAAQADCNAAGVADAHWQTACVLDVLCSGSSSAAERAELAGVFPLQRVPALRLRVVDTISPGDGDGGGDDTDNPPDEEIPPGNIKPENQAGACTGYCDTDTDCYIHGVADSAYDCDEANHLCRALPAPNACSRDLQCKTQFFEGRTCRADTECLAGNVCGASYQGQRFGSQGRCLMLAEQRECAQRITVTTVSGAVVDVCGRPNATCSEGICLVCAGDSDCGGRQPYCVRGRCRGCRTDQDCGGNTCRGGQCECESDADCPALDGYRHCNVATGACGCGSDGECYHFGRQWDSEQALCL